MWNTSFYIIIGFLTRNQSTRPLAFKSVAVLTPSVMADYIVFLPGWMEEGLLLGPVLISFTESCKMLKKTTKDCFSRNSPQSLAVNTNKGKCNWLEWIKNVLNGPNNPTFQNVFFAFCNFPFISRASLSLSACFSSSWVIFVLERCSWAIYYIWVRFPRMGEMSNMWHFFLIFEALL